MTFNRWAVVLSAPESDTVAADAKAADAANGEEEAEQEMEVAAGLLRQPAGVESRGHHATEVGSHGWLLCHGHKHEKRFGTVKIPPGCGQMKQ